MRMPLPQLKTLMEDLYHKRYYEYDVSVEALYRLGSLVLNKRTSKSGSLIFHLKNFVGMLLLWKRFCKLRYIVKQNKNIMANKNLTTEAKVKVFNKAKRLGDIAKLARETGYSQSMVSRTLSGQRNNESIVEKAYKLVSRRKLATA